MFEPSATGVTDAGLVFIKSCTKLNRLYLGGDAISDAGREFKGLTHLFELCLRGTQVTDAGLDHLKGLTALSRLDLSETRVTAEGIKKLKKALPKCGVNIWE